MDKYTHPRTHGAAVGSITARLGAGGCSTKLRVLSPLQDDRVHPGHARKMVAKLLSHPSAKDGRYNLKLQGFQVQDPPTPFEHGHPAELVFRGSWTLYVCGCLHEVPYATGLN